MACVRARPLPPGCRRSLFTRVFPAVFLAALPLIPRTGAAPAGPDRNVEPLAHERTPSARFDLVAELERYRRLVRDPERFHAGNAAAIMRRAYDELFALSPEQVDFRSIDRDPHAFLQGLFEVTLELDARMADFYAAGRFSEDLANAKRRVLRGVRFLRESILLRTAKRAPDRLSEHRKPALAEDAAQLHWNVHPRFRDASLEDLPRTFVLICMGPGNISAAIGRSADEDNMFSHLAIGYRSNREHVVKGTTHPPGTIFLLEALIETGVIIQPLSEHFDGIDRDVIFAVRDPNRQPAVDAAADAFFERAKQAYNAGENLRYDFSMGTRPNVADDEETRSVSLLEPPEEGRLPDPDRYFCSAVAQEIFQEAGLDLFPATTRINLGETTRALFRSWGIDTDEEVTAPGDADVSPVLLRVAEGARIEGIEANHLQQVVLTQVFHWMDADNYRLRWPPNATLKTVFFTFLHRVRLDFGIVPEGMNAGMLQTLLALDRASEVYRKALTRANEDFKEAQGRSMVPGELIVHLRSIRDTTPGARRWLRRMPWAQGTYQLRGQHGPVRLSVVPGRGMGFEVERRVGADVHRGTAKQRGRRLDVALDGDPATIRYRIEESGAIEGWVAGERRKPAPHGSWPRRLEAGRKVAGPVRGAGA